MVKVLITGATGLLGRSTFKAFKTTTDFEVFGTSFSRNGEGLINIDLTNQSALEDLISSLQPDIVVHCAAERRPDVAEKNPKAVHTLNVSLTSSLSQLSLPKPTSNSKGFFLIYISTDYVFSGTPPDLIKGYSVNDKVGPTNLYGVTKELGEREILKGLKEGEGGRGCCLRVPVLYGPVEKNSESAINCLLDIVQSYAANTNTNLSNTKEMKLIKMDNWATRYPTNVIDVARVLVDIAVRSQSQPIPPILQFSTQSPYTKYEICTLLASLLTPPIILKEDDFIKMDEGPKIEEGEIWRPKDCHLCNDAIEELGISTSNGIDFKTWWKEWLLTSSTTTTSTSSQ